MDSARKGRALAGTYPPPSFRCHKLLVMIVLLWLLQFYQAQANPVIFAHGDRVVQRKGEIGRLVCTASGDPRPNVTWEDERGTYFKRYYPYKIIETNITNTSFTSEMSVINLITVDYGVYQCVAKNKYGKAAANVTLAAQANPVIFALGDRVVQTLGKIGYLECTALGDPRPNVTWETEGGTTLRNDYHYEIIEKHITNTGFTSELSVMHVLKPDYMEYQCVAKNKYGKAAAKVTLAGDSKPVIFANEVRVVGVMYRVGRLKCTAFGDPRPDVTWERQSGRKIIHSYKNEIRETIITKNGFTSELSVMDLLTPDYGVYVCVASNKYGRAAANVTLAVAEPQV